MKIGKITNLSIFLISFFAFFFVACFAYAQQEEAPSPLGPGLARTQREIGILVGLGPTWQSGEFFPSCNCPNFTDGGKINFFAGFLYQQDFTSSLQWGGILGYQLLSNTASFQQKELIQFISESGRDTFSAPVNFRQKAQTSFNYISLTPFVNLSLFDFAFFRLGINVAFPISSTVLHTKELLDKTVRLENGEIVKLYLPGTNSTIATIEDGKIENPTSPFISLVPSVGFLFNLGTNVFAGLTYTHGIPLSTNANRGKDFRLNYWLISIELRIALQLRKF